MDQPHGPALKAPLVSLSNKRLAGYQSVNSVINFEKKCVEEAFFKC